MFRNYLPQLFFTFLCFSALSKISGQTISITGSFPDSVSPGQLFEVPFTIEKGSVSSFAKFQVDVPSGFYANPVDIHGGNWTFEQSRAKIVWVSIPAEASFSVKISFKTPAMVSSTSQFNVKFFYLENNVKKELDLNPYVVKIAGAEGSAISSNPISTSTVTSISNTATETVTANTNANTSNVGENQTVKETPTTTEIKPATNVNIIFRVQIGAFSTKPPQSKFAGLKDIWMYEESGLTKVTTGKFSSLKDAEDFKAQLKTKGTDGFVVEFDNGVHVKIH